MIESITYPFIVSVLGCREIQSEHHQVYVGNDIVFEGSGEEALHHIVSEFGGSECNNLLKIYAFVRRDAKEMVHLTWEDGEWGLTNLAVSTEADVWMYHNAFLFFESDYGREPGWWRRSGASF